MAVRSISAGEDFVLEAYNRKYQGAVTEALRINGVTGEVSIKGTALVAGAAADGIALAADKSISAAAGTGGVDLHLMTGTFKTPTGTFTFNGAISVASGKDIVAVGGASDIDYSASSGIWKGPTGVTTWAGKQAATAAANTIADPGTGVAIPVTTSGSVPLTIGSAGAETNSLAIPTFVGQVLDIFADTVGTGTRAITCAQAINVAGNTIMTFNAAWDRIRLTGITIGGALRWAVDVNTSVSLS